MRAMPLQWRVTLTALALFSLLAACQSANTGNERHTDGDEAVQADQSFTDPCAARLHDLEGALLLYYAIHKELPEKLTDLAPLANVDAPLTFTCPVSGLPYGYNRDGLFSPGKSKSIIVYDPTPAHAGRRWCIFSAPAKPGASRSLQVLSVTDPFFLGYLPLPR